MTLMPTTEHLVNAATNATPPPESKLETTTLKSRIEATVADYEAIQEKLILEAQGYERLAQMLKALIPFADDPDAEEALKGVLPFVRPPEPLPQPTPQPSPAPLQKATERVQVTRDLVFEATQAFTECFTVNNLIEVMTGQRELDKQEKARVRQAIATAMVGLHERGQVQKEEQGIGRKETLWKRTTVRIKGNARTA